MSTVMLVANRGYALKSSREGLIRALLQAGHRVVIATADDDHAHALKALGCVHEVLNFNRGGLNVAADFKAYRRLLALHRQYRPRLVHHFHAKPVILGSIAAHKVSGRACIVVNTITGLGHAFINGGWIRKLAGAGYARALHRADCTVFQNRDDRALFVEQGRVDPAQTELIVSSGVDVARFYQPPETRAELPGLRVLMVGRLLWQKGVGEFIEAARQLKPRFPEVVFALAGESDPVHPDAVPQTAIDTAVADGVIEFLGYREAIENEFARSAVFVLPSYREGVPRVILEAAAAAVPTVAADVPGTREAVVDGETGLLVAVKDASALAQALAGLLEDSGRRLALGRAAQARVAREFDIQKITDQHLALYARLGLKAEQTP
ncbi:glycosyltransferase family 4 protein [Granulosicoccaceae sp. 1_MG-2023]|nr:glycosyltransferase family 4 protein [Granulosicoccaceae sp. 1_MG-2023]